MAVDTYNPSTLELREANHMFNADLGYVVAPVEGRKEERREGGQRGQKAKGGGTEGEERYANCSQEHS